MSPDRSSGRWSGSWIVVDASPRSIAAPLNLNVNLRAQVNPNLNLKPECPMDVVERIKSQLSADPIVLFMKGTPDFPQCGFSAQTVAALRACNAQFAHVNIFEDPELREALKRYSNWPTYPQLY